METGGSRLPGSREGNTGAREEGEKVRNEKGGSTAQMKSMHREVWKEDLLANCATTEAFHGW